jgi:glucose-6-phosphate 1-dehydrogenase
MSRILYIKNGYFVFTSIVKYYNSMTESFRSHLQHPTAIVIFGGTGDLAATKLLPALLDLYVAGALPKQFVVLGLSRKELTDFEYQSYVRTCVDTKGHHHHADVVQEFCAHARYLSGSFAEAGTYDLITKKLEGFDASIMQCTNKLFYLAVPPQYYESIFTHLASSQAMKLCDGVGSWARLLVEKPFGKDLLTAQKLEEQLCATFTDEQIYRIDHYLAKDAIENIISLRFANSILADSWNKERIESMHVKLFETKDVASRGSFYDGVGTLRDVGQNHLLQILALLTMQAADVSQASSVRTARAVALEALLANVPEEIIRGQYAGFAETKGVASDSKTETYFKVSFVASAPEWSGVRMTLEAGKALSESVNEVLVTFRPLGLCHCAAESGLHEHRNVLRIQFTPEQVLSLSMWIKQPGFYFALGKHELELLHSTSADTYSPEAYERVLFDCIVGDQTRFVSGREVEAAWQFIMPILAAFADAPLHIYEQGSQGPIVTAE